MRSSIEGDATAWSAPELPRDTTSPHGRWILSAAAVAAFTAQIFASDSSYTAVTKICSGLLAALTAFALVRCAVVKPPRLPAIEYALLLFYATFGLAATLPPAAVGLAAYTPHPDAFELAAALALAGALAMLAGYAVWSVVPDRGTRRRYLPNLTPEGLDLVSAPYVLLCALFAVSLVVVADVKLRLGSVLAIVEIIMGAVPMVTVATLVYARRARARTFAVLAIALGATFGGTLVSSMLGDAITPVVAVAATWWRQRGKFPVVLAVGAMAMLYVLQPVKSYYRAIVWDERNAGVSAIDGWEQAFSRASADRGRQSGSDATRERLSELSTLAYVTDLIPSSMPYMGGDAYKQSAIAIVPRVLWPDKPNMTKEGLDRYVIALGLVTLEGAEHTTTGIHLLTHGYMSHGVAGALGWLLLFGFVLGAINRFCGQGIAGTIVMATILAGWIPSASSGFVGCFGGIWQTVAGAVTLVWLLRLVPRLWSVRRQSPG